MIVETIQSLSMIAIAWLNKPFQIVLEDEKCLHGQMSSLVRWSLTGKVLMTQSTLRSTSIPWRCQATLLHRRKIFSLEAPQLLTKSDFDDTISQQLRNVCCVPLPFTPTDITATVGSDRTILATTGLKARSAVMSASFHVHSVRGPLDGELRGSHEDG